MENDEGAERFGGDARSLIETIWRFLTMSGKPVTRGGDE